MPRNVKPNVEVEPNSYFPRTSCQARVAHVSRSSDCHDPLAQDSVAHEGGVDGLSNFGSPPGSLKGRWSVKARSKKN